MPWMAERMAARFLLYRVVRSTLCPLTILILIYEKMIPYGQRFVKRKITENKKISEARRPRQPINLASQNSGGKNHFIYRGASRGDSEQGGFPTQKKGFRFWDGGGAGQERRPPPGLRISVPGQSTPLRPDRPAPGPTGDRRRKRPPVRRRTAAPRGGRAGR